MRHRCDAYAIDAISSARWRRGRSLARARPTRELHTGRDAFWFARAWFMMCCAWSSRAWGCAAACTSSAASQKNMEGCPSEPASRRRRRRKSRTGSMAAAAPRRSKWAACGSKFGPLSLFSKNCTGFLCAEPKLGECAHRDLSSVLPKSQPVLGASHLSALASERPGANWPEQ